jgi:hypothetical protein
VKRVQRPSVADAAVVVGFLIAILGVALLSVAVALILGGIGLAAAGILNEVQG